MKGVGTILVIAALLAAVPLFGVSNVTLNFLVTALVIALAGAMRAHPITKEAAQ